MSYEEDLLECLQEGPVHYVDRRVVGKRIDLLTDMEKRGLITMRLVEVDDQESYLEVKLTEGRENG